MIIAMLLLQAASVDDIVVVGRRSCDLSIAGRAISGGELDRQAVEWRAGRTVQIVVPASLRTRCLAKVMFRLADRGVATAEFIDAPEGWTDRGP